MSGSNFTASGNFAAASPFPTELSGTQVLFNGVAAGLFGVTPDTIIGFVPWNVTEGPVDLILGHEDDTSPAFTLWVGPDPN
ncbi:MAG: hypothetical protein GY875_06515 [Gammaproteobacteria bacterium]|nr:hypothetical protein [Gammaproteobacteria bacterium]